MNCSHLKSVNIDSGVDYVYDYAFYGCSGLQEVSLPETAKIVGNSVFLGTPLEW